MHIDWDSKENGWIQWKMKPMFQTFLEGHGPQSSHQGRWRVTLIFGGVKIKYENGVFTMNSVDRELSGSIFIFEVGLAETELLQFKDFGRQ